MEQQYSQIAQNIEPSPIRKIRSILHGKDLIDLASGEPSPNAVPMETIKDAFARVTESLPTEATSYGLSQGRLELRQAAADMLADKGIRSTTDNIILVGGSQRGLDLAGRVILDPGDAILIEAPTYSGAIACFRNQGAHLIPVDIDDQGLHPQSLEVAVASAKSAGKRVKALYTIPSFQNPTGATLPLDRRRAIADLAIRENIYIIEDDPYGALYFNDDTASELQPLTSLAPDNGVYISSFSKIVTPALRAAYCVGPQDLISRMNMLAGSTDVTGGSLDQLLVLELVRSGVLSGAIKDARAYYRENCRVLIKSLNEFMPEGVTWNQPKGGFFVWLEVPDNITTVELLNAAVNRDVSFIPGKLFYSYERGVNRLRLSFSRETAGRIRVGIASLATAIRFWDMKKKIPWALGDCC